MDTDQIFDEYSDTNWILDKYKYQKKYFGY
jgi:hypothetical protein